MMTHPLPTTGKLVIKLRLLVNYQQSHTRITEWEMDKEAATNVVMPP